jgi:hypothetical protein
MVQEVISALSKLERGQLYSAAADMPIFSKADPTDIEVSHQPERL